MWRNLNMKNIFVLCQVIEIILIIINNKSFFSYMLFMKLLSFFRVVQFSHYTTSVLRINFMFTCLPNIERTLLKITNTCSVRCFGWVHVIPCSLLLLCLSQKLIYNKHTNCNGKPEWCDSFIKHKTDAGDTSVKTCLYFRCVKV